MFKKQLSKFGRNGLLISALAVLLTACANEATAPTDHALPEQAVLSKTPLKIPPFERLTNTQPRALKGQYIPVTWNDVPGWSEDNGEHLWQALVNNCRGLMRPISGNLTLPARATAQDWYPVCQAVAQQGLTQTPEQAKHFVQTYLRPWMMSQTGMATGYYEPIVQGSRSRTGAYQWPMYMPPDDLLTIDLGAVYPELAGKRVRGKLQGKKVVPYDTREQMAKNSTTPDVIAWLNDPVEAFFLQVQGSGRVQLDDGTMIRLAYADHNGRPYTSIGKWLADKGELPLAQTSMQNIKRWAKQNPNRVNEMLNVNQAMVFFKEEAIADDSFGPKGAYGIPLIAQRSIAVDTQYIPLGTPVFLSTSYPASNKPLQKVVFAQDTGAAIKGAARVDFFWGSGPQAGEMAGRMKQATQVWLLWPKQAQAPNAR